MATYVFSLGDTILSRRRALREAIEELNRAHAHGPSELT
jgi:hypothetical protein